MLPEFRGLYYDSSAGGGGIPPLQDTTSLPTSEYVPQYQVLQKASDEFLGKPENKYVADAVDQFTNYTKGLKYTDASRDLIAKAIPIAVSHQLNQDETSRVRKIDKTPYISHPLAMATEAARMHLHPTHIIACLLHDVPEDVKLGGLQASEDWLKMIAETYKDYDDLDRLMRILKAEQKTESLDKLPDREQVINYYADSALGRRALSYLQQSRAQQGNGHGDPSPADRESIAKVLYDMDRMISDSFIGEPGNKVFDPSIIVVKILDTWQNLQTPGFLGKNISDPEMKKDASTIAKLIRARMLANMAELMGMRNVSSSMTENLSLLQSLHSIDDPQLEKTKVGFEELIKERRHRMSERMRESQADSRTIRKACVSSNEYRDAPYSTYQVPWAVVERSQADDDTPPIVWHMPVKMRDNISDVVHSGKYTANKRELSVSEALSVTDGALRAAIQTAYGRPTIDYNVKAGDTNIGKLRIEADLPRYISTLKANEHHPSDPTKVPEGHIFHPDVCKYTAKTTPSETRSVTLQKIDTNLVNLLEFCFSPREFLSNTTGDQDTPYMIMIGGKIFLASNETDVTVWDMCQAEGISNPFVHPLGGSVDSAVPVKKGDGGVLDGLRKAGQLTMNMVVVTSGK